MRWSKFSYALLAGILMLLATINAKHAASQCVVLGGDTSLGFSCIAYDYYLDSIFLEQVNNPPSTGSLVVLDNNTGRSDSLPLPTSYPFSLNRDTSSFSNINRQAQLSASASLTISFSDNPSCNTNVTGTLTGCHCNVDGGTAVASGLAGNASPDPVVLCLNDGVVLAAQGDASFDELNAGTPAFANNVLRYAYYSCPPTSNIPGSDPCFLFFSTSRTGNDTLINTGGIVSLINSAGVTNNTIWAAPTTPFNGNVDPPTYLNTCSDVGQATQITLLDPVTATADQNCDVSGFDVFPTGGRPQVIGGTYSINIVSPAHATLLTANNINSGEFFTIGGLTDTEVLMYTITDDNLGCSSATLSSAPYVNASITADFSNVPACAESNTSFTDQSSASAVEWRWDFGDGNTSNLQNPNHAYSTGGSYTVRLVAVTVEGCKDTNMTTVVVNPTPVADFTHDPICSLAPVQFNDQSTISGGNIQDHSWDFGDGTSTTGNASPTKQYSTTGTYTVILTVTSDLNCSDDDTLGVVVENFEANFSNEGAYANSSTRFSDLSSASATFWDWDFGDGNTSIQQNPSHVFNGLGQFDVTLIARSSDCADTIVQTIEVFSNGFFIPNAFTPFNLGENDLFFIKGESIVSTTMQIFDKWGGLVFEGEDGEAMWDGTSGGKNVPQDVYVYKIDVLDATGQEHSFIGHVTLVD